MSNRHGGGISLIKILKAWLNVSWLPAICISNWVLSPNLQSMLPQSKTSFGRGSQISCAQLTLGPDGPGGPASPGSPAGPLCITKQRQAVRNENTLESFDDDALVPHPIRVKQSVFLISCITFTFNKSSFTDCSIKHRARVLVLTKIASRTSVSVYETYPWNALCDDSKGSGISQVV